MATLSLQPYPRALQAAPGNDLSSREAGDLIEAYGPQLVLAGRFPEGLLFTTAPTELVNFGACGHCLVLASPDELLALGTYHDPDSFEVFADKDLVLVCAPPLDGARAFILADLAWRESQLLETTVAGLESLAATASWTPERAFAATHELFHRYRAEARRWWANAPVSEAPHPRGRWHVYCQPGHEDEFADKLLRTIQRYARAPTLIAHHPIPPADHARITSLLEVAALAARHEDGDLVRETYRVLLSHPQTILGIREATCFPAKISGLEEVADEALTRIYHEEVLAVAAHDRESATRAAVSLDSGFVFGLDAAWNFATRALGEPNKLYAPEVARANLDTFLGGYLGDLDLTQSFLTGSAAMSSVLRNCRAGLFATHGDYLNSYYPATYTVVMPELVGDLRHLGRQHRWVVGEPQPFEFVDNPYPYIRKSPEERAYKLMVWYPNTPNECFIPYEVVPGADVDIAVVAEGEEFDRVAEGHYQAVKRRFPSAVLVRRDRERSHMYNIVSSAPPGVEAGFREVDIYPASWDAICTHHVGMVRLAFTAHGDIEAPPRFYLTASCLKAAVERATPNYYFFASRKTTPQDIMLKYATRGYPPTNLPGPLQNAIRAYARDSTVWRTPRSWRRNWGQFTGADLSRDCVGRYNVENYMVETRAFGHETPALPVAVPSSLMAPALPVAVPALPAAVPALPAAAPALPAAAPAVPAVEAPVAAPGQ